MLKYLLAAVAAVGVLGASAALVTSALFTDQSTVGSSVFITGTVDIAVSPASAALNMTNMSPGDMTTNTITVSNSGSLAFRYAIQAAADNFDTKGMRDVLRVRIAVRGGASCDAPYFNTSGSATTLSDDTEIYIGTGIPASPGNLVGSAATGAQPGDRTLGASAAETLCVGVVLPSTAGNTYQGSTTNATFDFVSEQIPNNP